MPTHLQRVLDKGVCPSCQKRCRDIDERYSYGAYAGVMCVSCAIKNYRDGCGLSSERMGTQADYEADNGPGSYEEEGF